MKQLMPFILTFIPIFVAVDSLGNIPIFISLTEGMNKKQRHEAVFQSVTTATIIAIIFMVIGKFLLRIMGITIDDFKIAGGVLLLVLSVNFLLPGRIKGKGYAETKDKDVGIFPLGTPLITGPAVLTTTLMMVDANGMFFTFISLILNMGIVGFVFVYSQYLMQVMGEAGTRAFSKVADIILAAIAVMMIRKGIIGAFFI